MKKFWLKFLLKTLEYSGWVPAPPTVQVAIQAIASLVHPMLQAAASNAVTEAERVGGSGEHRRREALRMLLNVCPQFKERDHALAIELALRGLI